MYIPDISSAKCEEKKIELAEIGPQVDPWFRFKVKGGQGEGLGPRGLKGRPRPKWYQGVKDYTYSSAGNLFTFCCRASTKYKKTVSN